MEKIIIIFPLDILPALDSLCEGVSLATLLGHYIWPGAIALSLGVIPLGFPLWSVGFGIIVFLGLWDLAKDVA